MQALKITVPGKFYDSQIYNGRLYIWRTNGSLVTIDWNSLVDKINIAQELKVALRLSLQHSDELYGNLLLQDTEVRDLVKSKFQKLSDITVEVKNQDLENCIINQQDSPFPFPHADSAIHYEAMYVGSQSGVSAAKCNTGQWVEQSVEIAKKLFDIPVLSISASHKTLAVAAGNEGLFDYSLASNSTKKHAEPRNISKNHCNLTRWLYPSIFGSSYFNDGYFADFKTSKKNAVGKEQSSQEIRQIDSRIGLLEKGKGQKSEMHYERNFQSLVSSREIFAKHKLKLNCTETNENTDNTNFTWGVQDKLCSLTGNSVELAQYIPDSRSKDTKRKFKDLGSVEITESNGEIISADSSFFGIILEQEDGLLVVSSSLESQFLKGEPVNWRVFPKARNYSNQLHVIYDNELHIYSFNHDYFVDQSTKKLGISVALGKKSTLGRKERENIDEQEQEDVPF
jgi:hypothetical protein